MEKSTQANVSIVTKLETKNFIKEFLHFSIYATEYEKPKYGWENLKSRGHKVVYEKFGDPFTDIYVDEVTSDRHTYSNNPNYKYIGELGYFRYSRNY